MLPLPLNKLKKPLGVQKPDMAMATENKRKNLMPVRMTKAPKKMGRQDVAAPARMS